MYILPDVGEMRILHLTRLSVDVVDDSVTGSDQLRASSWGPSPVAPSLDGIQSDDEAKQSELDSTGSMVGGKRPIGHWARINMLQNKALYDTSDPMPERFNEVHAGRALINQLSSASLNDTSSAPMGYSVKHEPAPAQLDGQEIERDVEGPDSERSTPFMQNQLGSESMEVIAQEPENGSESEADDQEMAEIEDSATKRKRNRSFKGLNLNRADRRTLFKKLKSDKSKKIEGQLPAYSEMSPILDSPFLQQSSRYAVPLTYPSYMSRPLPSVDPSVTSSPSYSPPIASPHDVEDVTVAAKEEQSEQKLSPATELTELTVVSVHSEESTVNVVDAIHSEVGTDTEVDATVHVHDASRCIQSEQAKNAVSVASPIKNSCAIM